MTLSNEDSKKSTPMRKLENTVTVSLEKQVKDLLQDDQLPQFNETFLANLQALKSQMQDSDWMGFESWVRHWLIFQMAQQNPPEPTPTPAAASGLQTKCQLEAGGAQRIGFYRPQCDEQGNYKPMQCWHSTGFCWCVDRNGEVIPGTSVRGKPMCEGRTAERKMAMPSLTRLMKDMGEH
ncbi:hypothetical protein COCON_G00041100 [Conger conger]|uniref:Thyroglobulin type-1 domain-containing protein n=1 Tax=Conger conger TaxID=82655 RepID=A0A9Q1DTS4_CONCO|nr:hypothetical protein COCON_G00041100 [Conger conger]